MVLKFAALGIALFYATSFPGYAQSAPKTDCIDPAGIRRQQVVDRDTAGNLRSQTITAMEGQADRQQEAYRIYLTLADFCETEHRFADAEQYYRSAYALAKNAFGERSNTVGRALYGIGTMLLQQGRIREADVSLRQALSIVEADKSANSLDIASILNNMAFVQQMTNNFSNAAELMRKVVGIFETNPASEAAELGGVLSNLAAMLRYVGNSSEAVTVAERAASILVCCRGSIYFTSNLVTRGVLRLDEGDLAGAEALLLRALSTMEEPAKQGSPTHALVLTHLGALYTRNGRHGQAEQYFQRALEINRRLLTPDHPRLLESISAYAALLRATKRKGEAKKLEAYVDQHRKRHQSENPTLVNVVDVHTLMKQSGR